MPIYLLFETFGVWWWILIAVFGLIATGFLANECYGFVAFLISLVCVVLTVFGTLPLATWVLHHPLAACCWIDGYGIAGVTWGTIKWFIFLHKEQKTFSDVLHNVSSDKFHDEFGMLQQNQKWEVLKVVADNFGWLRLNYTEKTVKPDRTYPWARDYSDKISSWMAFWPLSLIGSLFNDLLKNIFEFVTDALKNVFNNISVWMFKDISSMITDDKKE